MRILSPATRRMLADTGAKIPIIKGPMYPGSNPELVAAVSEANGFGIVQPISLTTLYAHDFRAGLQLIKSLTSKPFGVNLTIIDNKKYARQMDEWMDIAVDEGVRFFLTSVTGASAHCCGTTLPLLTSHARSPVNVGRSASQTRLYGLPRSTVSWCIMTCTHQRLLLRSRTWASMASTA